MYISIRHYICSKVYSCSRPMKNKTGVECCFSWFRFEEKWATVGVGSLGWWGQINWHNLRREGADVGVWTLKLIATLISWWTALQCTLTSPLLCFLFAIFAMNLWVELLNCHFYESKACFQYKIYPWHRRTITIGRKMSQQTLKDQLCVGYPLLSFG